ncbi:hypothetical protein MASR2M8_15430 [Opitutaceae bacterium]
MTSTPGPRSILVSRRLLVGLGVIFVAPWLLLLVAIRDLSSANRPHEHAASPAQTPVPAVSNPSEEGLIEAKAGPWGHLLYTRILIEPPEDLVARNQQSNLPVRWSFAGYTPSGLTELWQAAQLPATVVAELNAPDNRTYAGDRTEIRVRHQIINELSPEARATIYEVLARFPENELHVEPFRFRADAVDEWFNDSGVPPATIDRVKRLLYRRGPAVLFSDLEVVLAQIPSLEERTRLIKTLARKSTLLVRLVLDEQSDLDTLADYWGRGQRSKDVRPLLQSLRRKGSASRIDIAHLLPRFARARLYSYPSTSGAEHSLEFMDCHWTAMNFFKLEPDPRFQDINVVSMTLLGDYRQVTGRSELGDILLFARQDGSIAHSCVYIADDIVFTKNGTSPASPWILMNLPDVLAIYPSKEPFDIQRYRLKTLD